MHCIRDADDDVEYNFKVHIVKLRQNNLIGEHIYQNVFIG